MKTYFSIYPIYATIFMVVVGFITNWNYQMVIPFGLAAGVVGTLMHLHLNNYFAMKVKLDENHKEFCGSYNKDPEAIRNTLTQLRTNSKTWDQLYRSLSATERDGKVGKYIKDWLDWHSKAIKTNMEMLEKLEPKTDPGLDVWFAPYPKQFDFDPIIPGSLAFLKYKLQQLQERQLNFGRPFLETDLLELENIQKQINEIQFNINTMESAIKFADGLRERSHPNPPTTTTELLHIKKKDLEETIFALLIEFRKQTQLIVHGISLTRETNANRLIRVKCEINL